MPISSKSFASLALAIAAMASVPAAAQQAPRQPAARQPAAPAAPAAAPQAQMNLSRTQFVADMDAEFSRMDGNRDRRLTQQEIEQYRNASTLAQAQANNRAAFNQLDVDRNGWLSADEFAKMIRPIPPANAQPMIQQMDANRDQQISQVEHRNGTLANFDRLDANRDGVVTAEEMRAGGIGAPPR